MLLYLQGKSCLSIVFSINVAKRQFVTGIHSVLCSNYFALAIFKVGRAQRESKKDMEKDSKHSPGKRGSSGSFPSLHAPVVQIFPLALAPHTSAVLLLLLPVAGGDDEKKKTEQGTNN
jgi:hypothetical protein